MSEPTVPFPRPVCTISELDMEASSEYIGGIGLTAACWKKKKNAKSAPRWVME